MSPLENLLRAADAEAARLGHVIVWDTVGEQMANGRCSGCGHDLMVATSHRGHSEQTGRALQESCTRGLAIENPLRRRSLVSSGR